MTDKPWRLERLGALADEWIAERESFHSGLHAYLDTHLRQCATVAQETLPLATYQAELATISTHLMQFVRAMDGTVWYTLRSPERMAAYQAEQDAAFGTMIAADSQRLAALTPPDTMTAVHTATQQALGLALHILRMLKDMPKLFDFSTFFFIRRLVSQLKYRLYPARTDLPAFQRYWLLDDAEFDTCEPSPDAVHPESGIQRYDIDDHRCAYTAYVPEYYRPDHAWPVILALHGGSGNDEDFLWAWLKYAKSRGYLLISGKSFGPTWHPWDASSVLLMLDDMQSRYTIDSQRILLTGLSDGGSFGYEVGFAFPERFAGLAVVAGILRPHQRSDDTSRLPVYIAHGEKDQLFPIGYIRAITRTLEEWGHNVTYHEIPDFGHAYPPGENAAILDWFARRTASDRS